MGARDPSRRASRDCQLRNHPIPRKLPENAPAMTIDRRTFLSVTGGAVAGVAGHPLLPPTALPFASLDREAGAIAAAGGGVIDLPAGTYLVDSIRIPRVRGGTIRFVG